MLSTYKTYRVLKTVNYSLMPNRRAGAWQGIFGGPGKITKILLAGGLESAGGLGNFLSLYLKGLCWMEFLPECNS